MGTIKCRILNFLIGKEYLEGKLTLPSVSQTPESDYIGAECLHEPVFNKSTIGQSGLLQLRKEDTTTREQKHPTFQ